MIQAETLGDGGLCEIYWESIEWNLNQLKILEAFDPKDPSQEPENLLRCRIISTDIKDPWISEMSK